MNKKPWLTPEEAVKSANIKLSAATLASYPSRKCRNITVEERFQNLGLLFDRERWRNGEPAYLRLIKPAPEESTSLDEEAENDDKTASEETFAADAGDVEDSEAREDTSVPSPEETAGETDEREIPLTFASSEIRIVITLAPVDPRDPNPHSRPAIVAVGNMGDIPLFRRVRVSELGTLPPLVAELLEQLKEELPRRMARRTKNETRQQQPHALERKATSSKTTSTLAENASSPIQLKLF